MGLAKLKEKYDPLKEKNGVASMDTDPTPSHGTRFQSWKDSASVYRLSDYLKKQQSYGIRLYQRNRSFVLYLEPAMTKHEFNGDRGQILNNIYILLNDAVEDLQYLISKGLIDIPDAPNNLKPKESIKDCSRVLPETSSDTGNSM